VVSLFSIVIFLVAAAASWLRGGRYVHDELEAAALEASLLATEGSQRRSERVNLALEPARDDD
jgi:hypothetical protein